MGNNELQICPQCEQELSPVGNFSYGRSKFTESAHNILHITIPAVAIIVIVMGLLALFVYIIIPFILLYIALSLIPKTTKIHCHHCGYKRELIGNHLFQPVVTSTPGAAPMGIKKAEVIDQSKTLTAHKKTEVNDEPPNKG